MPVSQPRDPGRGTWPLRSSVSSSETGSRWLLLAGAAVKTSGVNAGTALGPGTGRQPAPHPPQLFPLLEVSPVRKIQRWFWAVAGRTHAAFSIPHRGCFNISRGLHCRWSLKQAGTRFPPSARGDGDMKGRDSVSADPEFVGHRGRLAPRDLLPRRGSVSPPLAIIFFSCR